MLRRPFGGGGASKSTVKKIAKGLLPNPNQVLINDVDAAAGANPINGTTNTSVPLFDDSTLVQVGNGIGVTATADSAASGTIFTMLSPGIYHAKFMFTAAASQSLEAAIARDPTEPINGDAIFGGQAGVVSAGTVVTPAATDAAITVEADLIVTPNDIQVGNNVVVPLVTIVGAASPNEDDFASSVNIHFELTQIQGIRA